MYWVKLLVPILYQIIKHISPEIKKTIKGLLAELKAKAKLTENPWDDLLVELLEAILNVEN